MLLTYVLISSFNSRSSARLGALDFNHALGTLIDGKLNALLPLLDARRTRGELGAAERGSLGEQFDLCSVIAMCQHAQSAQWYFAFEIKQLDWFAVLFAQHLERR